jgi:dTDP-glucose 4,6-dehydratase
MSSFEKNILITGGAGFIGSHVVRLFVQKYPNYRIINFDKLTYAGNLENVADIAKNDNYAFVQGDICDAAIVKQVIEQYKITHILHLAAESHVDRSIDGPIEFINTNIIGTVQLLEAARDYWQATPTDDHHFYHISTDEVYGTLGKQGYFTEQTPYDPRSPYSASKAASDHIVRAYYHTYNLPVVLSNCSNNYGTHQYPEKLIPVVIQKIAKNEPIPVYGSGDNIRDWLFVNDHANAIDVIFHTGKNGETYNIGGNNEWDNLALVEKICQIMDQKLHKATGTSKKLITFVTDRKGHDKRYAIDATKLQNELGWQPAQNFDQNLSETIDWYLNQK